MKGLLHIRGAWREGRGEVFTSHDPAHGILLWEGASADERDVDDAMRAAEAAFGVWGGMPLTERIACVERYKAELECKAEELALIIARETGKVLWDAKGEVQAMIGKIAISIAAYHERTGSKSAENAGVRSALAHRPHGVAAVFGPYNFPGHLPNGHIVPALIAGNTVVFKPSDYTPLVAEAMVECWEAAGLPEGVINLVQGGRGTGIALAAHPLLNALYFTGSAEVGALLHKQFGGRTEVMLALEMGGNNPLIVHEVSDIKAAALLAVQSAFVTTGQRCTCARRLILPKGAEGDAFLGMLAELAQRLRIGVYNDTPEPFMGPLIGAREGEKLLAAQENLLALGGKPLLPLTARADNRAFVTPGIIDVTAVQQKPDREYFGPLLQVTRAESFEAAIVEANNTRYGLSAGLFSDNEKRYDTFMRFIRAGVVAWNRPTTGASSALPFGGIGISGNHRPSAYLAADYAAYPVAVQGMEHVEEGKLPPGIIP